MGCKPTQEEVDDWNGRILQIVEQVDSNCVQQPQPENAAIPTSRDQIGQQVESNRESLPQCLRAALNECEQLDPPRYRATASKAG